MTMDETEANAQRGDAGGESGDVLPPEVDNAITDYRVALRDLDQEECSEFGTRTRAKMLRQAAEEDHAALTQAITAALAARAREAEGRVEELKSALIGAAQGEVRAEREAEGLRKRDQRVREIIGEYVDGVHTAEQAVDCIRAEVEGWWEPQARAAEQAGGEQ